MGPVESDVLLEVGQFSHRGRRRLNNEDWLGTFQPDDARRLARKGRLFLVADGMGGHESGELASRLAVDQVIRGYLEDSGSDVAASLGRAIEAANANLYARAAPAAGRMRSGTTLVAAVVRGAELWTANVGDSRAYLLRGGELRQLSRDHALLSVQDKQALPAGERAGMHLITRALGTKPSVAVDLYPPQKLRRGDQVLLCSDGLTTPLSDGEIGEIVGAHPSQAAAEALVRAANERGGPDNVSVIVIRVVGSPSNGRSRGAHRLDPPSGLWKGLLHLLPGAGPGLQSPLFLVMIVLIALALIGLGVILGLLLL